MTHLVFYDGECGLCDFIVSFLLKKDKERVFLFAPLQGKTAQKKLTPDLIEKDTLILIENFGTDQENILLFGKAALRIAWYLGGFFTLFGILSFVKSTPFDFIYKIVARNRSKFFKNRCTLLKNENDRFLD
jgi:predicted DCC family thiol-disulfide oxidoreductase YuxK